MEQKLRDLSLHLLDLGKRNRLLNYKDSGYRTLTILNDNYDVLFDKITSGQSLSFFDIDSVLKKYNDVIEGNDVSIEDYSIGKVKDIAYKILKNNDILGYRKGVSTSKILKVINKEYNNILTEKGINPLYLSFGLVTYLDGKQEYNAPFLLIPVKLFIEKGIYKLKEQEDEVLLNPTLAYLLKTNYEITLNEYNDEPFVDYFLKNKIVLESNGMKLTNHIGIGIYSFLKMNMFNDLTNNKDIVLQNKNVQRILGKTGIEDDIVDLDVYPVVNADESQLNAIKYAVDGASFVLQGPPGSGKSQTITNIISSAVANGKKVLFVSEKQAALNVVYENLRRADLDSFCLALHSHKANKKDFIDELYKTAILPRYDIQDNVEDIKLNHKYYEHTLDDYIKAIHTKIKPYNLSMYDLYSRYLAIEKPGFSIQNLRYITKDLNELNKNKILIENYSSTSSNCWYDYRLSPFYGLMIEDLNFINFKAEGIFNELVETIDECVWIKDTINEFLPLELNSFSDILNNIESVNQVIKLNYFSKEFFNKNQREKLIYFLESYIKAKDFVDNSTIEKFFDLNILHADLNYYLKELTINQSFFKFLKPSYHRLKRELKYYSKLKMNDLDLISKLKEAIKYNDSLNVIKDVFPILPRGYTLEEYKQMYKELLEFRDFKYDLCINKVEFDNMKKHFIDIMIKFKELDGFVKFTQYFDNKLINLLTDSLDLVLNRIELMRDNLNQLDVYYKQFVSVNELKKNKLLDFVHICLDNNKQLDKFNSYYESVSLENIIYDLINKNNILKEFVVFDIDNIIKEFKRLDELFLEANKAMIISKLSKLRPDDSIMAGSEFAVLIKEYNKSRKQKPIRVLLEEVLELILNIKPVFLMSPLSVSTYLSSNLNMFDMVIFDEASQVFAWDAIGAIYRAKQCIIIGDSKQMPPSNFFNTIVEDEDEYNDELESILDKGTTIFNTKQLNWHYRSRSEELIAFSNENFYSSKLITIPQAKKHTKGFGIDFYYIDGIYEAKRRVNEREAQYIVDLVIEHFENKNESLGVVAFSTSQAELIEDLLEEKLALRPDIISKMEQFVDEPFFVKNLEAVQGDERDRIIFSICYGYNSEHKFYQRFGPLNNVGGERRLNVAITRAKYNVSVVSSIKSSDIRLDNTESLGVKLLKEYLEYVENITVEKHDTSNGDGVVNDIARFLKDNGFMVNTNVGKSSFKIDLAVIHPLTREYLAAIMVDGKSCEIGNCSDTFRLQEILLTRLGWKYYRIFSTLWLTNNNNEKEKLLSFLNGNVDFVDNKRDENPIDFLVEDNSDIEDSFEEYPYTTESEIKEMYDNKGLSEIIYRIVEKEQPISVEYLLKRICILYGRTKVTNVVRRMFKEDLMELNLIEKDGYLMINHITEMKLRINSDRMIEDVHTLELQDAIYTIVKKSNGIEKDGCFKMVVKLLGYNRMSDNAVSYLENALIFLMLEGKVIEKENRLYV